MATKQGFTTLDPPIVPSADVSLLNFISGRQELDNILFGFGLAMILTDVGGGRLNDCEENFAAVHKSIGLYLGGEDIGDDFQVRSRAEVRRYIKRNRGDAVWMVNGNEERLWNLILAMWI